MVAKFISVMSQQSKLIESSLFLLISKYVFCCWTRFILDEYLNFTILLLFRGYQKYINSVYVIIRIIVLFDKMKTSRSE